MAVVKYLKRASGSAAGVGEGNREKVCLIPSADPVVKTPEWKGEILAFADIGVREL